MKRGVFVPPGNRCCSVHFYKDYLSYQAMNTIEGNIAGVMCLGSNGVVNHLNIAVGEFSEFRTLQELSNPKVTF